MTNKTFRVTVTINECLGHKKYPLGNIEVEVRAKNKVEARKKARVKAAKRLFRASNLSIYDINERPGY